VSAILSANAELIITIVKIALLLFIVLTVNAYLTWFERKLVAHIQSRWGPHRVGPHGLLQPLADGLKFLFKEDPTPAGADKFVYYLAPLLALAREHQIEMPITEQVDAILHAGKSPKDAIRDIMERPLKRE